MFSINLYGKPNRVLSSNTWGGLRSLVETNLKKRPGTKWGHLRDDTQVFIVGPRSSMRNYPLKCPEEPMD